jgi:hypothetical protein
MSRSIHRFTAALALASVTSVANAQTAVQIRVTALSPALGTALTPMWLGVHDGTFRVFTAGEAASAGLEAIAEDGNTAILANTFGSAGFTTQHTLPGPSGVFLGGESATHTFMLDASNPMQRYLSYASMVVPSNDAFIATMNPMARDLTDGMGNFRNFSFTVMGSQVWDAGTEVNDELEANTAFFGQTMPNTGVNENGVVALHPGFIPDGRILGSDRFQDADFTQAGYQLVRFDISVVPEPSTWTMLLGGLVLLTVVARRRAGMVSA